MGKRKGSGGGDAGPDEKEAEVKHLKPGRTSATKLEFWTQFSTPLLFYWLHDFDGVDVSDSDIDDRDKIISLLVNTKGITGPEGPDPLAALQDNWCTQTGKPATESPGLFQPGRKKPKIPALPPPIPPKPKPAPSPIQGQCSGCLTPFTVSVTSGATCLNPACGQLRADLPYEHAINAEARLAANIKNSGSGGPGGSPSQPRTSVGMGPFRAGSVDLGQSQGSAAAMSQSPTHTGDAAADLDQRSTGLRDAAAVAAQRDYPSYASKEPVTVATALAISAQAVKGNDYLAPSEGLLAYIRSGVLSDVSFALPIPAEAAFRVTVPQRGHQDPTLAAYLRQSRGVITPHRAATSLTDFCLAFAATIGPALIEQPLALAHWLAFLRSVIEIHEATHSWEQTVAYIAKHLQTRIHRRESIGPDDQLISTKILLMAQSSFGSSPAPAPANLRPPQQSQGSAIGGKGGPKSKGGGDAGKGKQVCRFYNGKSGCKKHSTECSHAHVCSGCGSKEHGVSKCGAKARKGESAQSTTPAIPKQEE